MRELSKEIKELKKGSEWKLDKSEGNYPVYPNRITYGVVFCDELAYDSKADGREWDKDHPQCTPVFLCKYHYYHY